MARTSVDVKMNGASKRNDYCKKLELLELLDFLDYHKPGIVAIQETRIDGSISTSELLPDSCLYNAYTCRKDRNLHGGAVMLLIHKKIPYMPLIELENDPESVWAKVFTNKTSHCIASWYQEPSGSCKDFFQISLSALSPHIRNFLRSTY